MADVQFTTRFKTRGGTHYRIYQDSPTITITTEGGSATETYLMKASAVPAFIIESLPPPVVIDGRIIRPAGRRMPGATLYVTEDIKIKPHTGGLPMDPFSRDTGAEAGTYSDLAQVTINYKIDQTSEKEPNPDDPKTFLEHSFEAGGEVLIIPSANLEVKPPTEEEEKPFFSYGAPEMGNQMDEAAERVKEAREAGETPDPCDLIQVADPGLKAVKIMPTIQHTFRWPWAMKPNFPLILDTLGHVNDRSSSIMFNAEPDTVLFMGLSGRRKYLWGDTTGTTITPFDLSFKFSQRRYREQITCSVAATGTREATTKTLNQIIGWQHIYRPETGVFQMVLRRGRDGERKANRQLLYPRANFDSMFTTSG